jgi:hypothetical protein
MKIRFSAFGVDYYLTAFTRLIMIFKIFQENNPRLWLTGLCHITRVGIRKAKSNWFYKIAIHSRVLL